MTGEKAEGFAMTVDTEIVTDKVVDWYVKNKKGSTIY
jgi:hypothetical protein